MYMYMSSNTMALIASGCGATRLPEHQMALTTSGLCPPPAVTSTAGKTVALSQFARCWQVRPCSHMLAGIALYT